MHARKYTWVCACVCVCARACVCEGGRASPRECINTIILQVKSLVMGAEVRRERVAEMSRLLSQPKHDTMNSTLGPSTLSRSSRFLLRLLCCSAARSA